MLRLLGRATSGNVQKVVWALEEMGLDYQREDYGRQFGNTGGDYLALNPNGKVPTLIDGETTIWESNSILRYLANSNGGRFYPAEPGKRALVDQWMDWQLASLNAPYVAIFKESKKAPEERGADFAATAAELSGLLKVLEGGIQAKGFLPDAGLTLADICFGPIVKRCLAFPIDTDGLDKLTAWQTSLQERPAFTKAVSG
ncbi:MAG: glutathione S-transferase family protein [Rhodospirillales bacterium]